jgi:hypothetical protein
MENRGRKLLAAAAAGIVVLSFAFGSVSAEEKKKKEPLPPACNTLKDEFGCMNRQDCTWVHASVDPKTQKEKRKAYCRAKPKKKT